EPRVWRARADIAAEKLPPFPCSPVADTEIRSAVAPNAGAATASPTSATAQATANLPAFMLPPATASALDQAAVCREHREIGNHAPPSRPGTRRRRRAGASRRPLSFDRPGRGFNPATSESAAPPLATRPAPQTH